MTVIDKICLRGFKSFAKPIELEFSKGYSVIVGPNGSGKSNVCDAATFVLGRASAKSMRAERSSNLIFNGGKTGSPFKEAEVSIYFSNKEKEFPVATEVVKISRIVRQSGASIYKINDEKHTRQEVLDLLAKARVYPDGFNIVLQGDIVLFTEMKPDERRILIEDISGITVYEDKKQKALLELDKVEQKLNDANIILKERETYLRELKKERDQASHFKELESKIKESKATHLHLQIKNKEEQKSEIESKIKKQQEYLEGTNKKISEFNEKIRQKRSLLDEINMDIEEKGEKDQVILQQNVEALREHIIKDSTRSDNVKQEIGKINQRILQLSKDKEEMREKIKNLREQHDQQNKDVNLLNKDVRLL